MNAVMRESLQEDKVVVDPVGARVLPDRVLPNIDATSREATAERWVRPTLGVCLRLA